MLFDGISIHILHTNGSAYIEYKDPLELKDSENITQALIELPPPDLPQEFGFAISSNIPYESNYFSNGHKLEVSFNPDNSDTAQNGGYWCTISKENCQGVIYARDGINVGKCRHTQLRFKFQPLEIGG